MARSDWINLTDAQLLAQCAVDTYRASGPGGQKRNKTSSAVRLRHLPSGLIVIAEESRSQHENKAKAVRRLRERFHLQLREPYQPAAAAALGDFTQFSRRDPRFWLAGALVLDLLEELRGHLKEAATQLHVSTGRLVDFLQGHEALWTQVNRLRQRHGLKPLLMN